MSGVRKRFVLILPLLSMLVAVSIVAQQYARREGLRRDLTRYTREYIALEARLPKNSAPVLHDHHDD